LDYSLDPQATATKYRQKVAEQNALYKARITEAATSTDQLINLGKMIEGREDLLEAQEFLRKAVEFRRFELTKELQRRESYLQKFLAPGSLPLIQRENDSRETDRQLKLLEEERERQERLHSLAQGPHSFNNLCRYCNPGPVNHQISRKALLSKMLFLGKSTPIELSGPALHEENIKTYDSFLKWPERDLLEVGLSYDQLRTAKRFEQDLLALKLAEQEQDSDKKEIEVGAESLSLHEFEDEITARAEDITPSGKGTFLVRLKPKQKQNNKILP